MHKFVVIIGTRPEAIKLLPVYRALLSHHAAEVTLLATGQHRELLDEVFEIFGCQPDIRLAVMEADQTLSRLTEKLISVLDQQFSCKNFDVVVVQGDTTTAFAASLVAFYRGIPVAHVEAGLRTSVIQSPFPEEFNRRAVSLVARWHFTPTLQASRNLFNEGILENVHMVGNTVIDSALLAAALRQEPRDNLLDTLPWLADPKERHVLVTVHRRESFGKGISSIAAAIATIARRNPHLHIVLPVHPNPNVRGPLESALAHLLNVHLIGPLRYDDLIHVLRTSYIVLTDSGGIQEEAPAFGVPVIVMRAHTERPEGIEAGCSALAGFGTDSIVSVFEEITENPFRYRRMSGTKNPYGDGTAAQRIAEILLEQSEHCAPS